MGYELHIVRSEEWSDSSASPILKADVDQLLSSDDELSWSTTDYIDMKEADGSTERFFLINWKEEPVFWWYRSEISCKNPNDAQTLKLAEMANALGALLLGDDGERYTLGKSFFGKPKVIVSNA